MTLKRELKRSRLSWAGDRVSLAVSANICLRFYHQADDKQHAKTTFKSVDTLAWAEVIFGENIFRVSRKTKHVEFPFNVSREIKRKCDDLESILNAIKLMGRKLFASFMDFTLFEGLIILGSCITDYFIGNTIESLTENHQVTLNHRTLFSFPFSIENS